jgi:hypothetical protein
MLTKLEMNDPAIKRIQKILYFEVPIDCNVDSSEHAKKMSFM